jgi:hypothetical protein
LLAELLYELTTHYPARAHGVGTEPTIEIPMHTPQSVETWLVDIEKWLKWLRHLLCSPIWWQKTLDLITEGTRETREAVSGALAHMVGANVSVGPEQDLQAVRMYVMEVDRVVEATKAQLSSVRRYRKRLPARWLVRVVGLLGAIAVATGVLVPMLDMTVSHRIDLWIPAGVYTLAVLSVLGMCLHYSRDAGARRADASAS